MTKIWTNQVDKKYDVYVETGETRYKGFLKIELNGKVLHSEPVDISYGAKFGPDAQDVNDWCNKCIAFVDNLEASVATTIEETKEIQELLPVINDEVKTRKVEDILNEYDVFMTVSYNRYGGGLVAALARVSYPTVIDDIFTGSDDENYLGTTLMDQLSLPYVVGADPRKIVDELLSKVTTFTNDEFNHKFRRLFEVMKNYSVARESIENGSFAKEVIEEWKNQNWTD